VRADYEKMFREGQCPVGRALLREDGSPSEWRVRMVSGPVPDLSRLHHRKRFESVQGVILGHNVTDVVGKWGRFSVRHSPVPGKNGLLDGGMALCLDYSGRNGSIVSRVRDYVRLPWAADRRVMVGQFRLLLLGRERILGYFLLEELP